MKKEAKFEIEGLGNFAFVASLITLDYPRTFIAKRLNNFYLNNDEPLEIFLFDEIDVNNNSITWAAVEISYDELDQLNSGIKTVQSCYIGPRKTKRIGYKIISIAGKEKAACERIENIYDLMDKKDTYVDEFVKDSHGAGVLSLITDKLFLSVVLDARKNASPLITSRYFQKIIDSSRTMFNSLPYSIDTINNKFSYTTNHSIVLNIELASRLNEDTTNEEGHNALQAIKTFFKSDDEKEILNAFKSEKRSITGVSNFVKILGNFNPDGSVTLGFIDSKKGSTSEFLDKKKKRELIQKGEKCIASLDKSSKITKHLTREGRFIMLDVTKGKGKFKFETKDEFGNKVVIRGNSDLDLMNYTNLPLGIYKNYIYKAFIDKITYEGAYGKTKPIYILIGLEKGENFEQLTFIDNK